MRASLCATHAESWSVNQWGLAMVNRSIAALSRLCTSAVLVVLGTTALMQMSGATPAAAAGTSNGIFGWGVTPTLETMPPGVDADPSVRRVMTTDMQSARTGTSTPGAGTTTEKWVMGTRTWAQPRPCRSCFPPA